MRLIEKKLLLLVLTGLVFGCGTTKVDKKPLNVLFIAVDDLRPEMGCYGNNILKTLQRQTYPEA